MSLKKVKEAVAVFERYVELYPESANAYDSLGEGLETDGRFEAAAHSFQRAIELGTKYSDESLPDFKKHLERANAEAKAIVPAK